MGKKKIEKKIQSIKKKEGDELHRPSKYFVKFIYTVVENVYDE